MADPLAGLREMARVTKTDGIVAACVWDHAGSRGPLSVFWNAARELDRDVEDESRLPGAREGSLSELFQSVGLREVEEQPLSVDVEHRSFEEWWEPFTLGVGPAGGYVARLNSKRKRQLRDLCDEMLPAAPFVVTGRAWAARVKGANIGVASLLPRGLGGSMHGLLVSVSRRAGCAWGAGS
jgi:hypothetical protein